MNFKAGDKVLCIKEGLWTSDIGGYVFKCGHPIKGCEYIVESADSEGYLRFKEFAFSYNPIRFIKATDQKDDHTFTNSITKKLGRELRKKVSRERDYNPLEIPKHLQDV